MGTSSQSRIPLLLVEDDPTIRRMMLSELESQGFLVTAAPSAEEAREKLTQLDFDVILLDIHLPGIDGISFFRSLKDQSEPPQVVILSGETRFDLAVEALRLGAYDYVVKPPNPDVLKIVCEKASQKRQMLRDISRLRLLLAHQQRTTQPLGESPAFKRLLILAQMAAPTDTPVLLLGETGAGKEVMATYLHQISARHDGPFVAINCAAIPDNLMESELFGYEKGAFTGAQRTKPGYFEMAEGGTLFLDEIGDMDISTQTALLRAVETGTYYRVGGTKPLRVDVRIVSATNRDLRSDASAGLFRQDLYFRLQGFDLHIPPLRKRLEDIPILVTHFLARKDDLVVKVSPRAIEALKRYGWPGNVRELAHVIEKARILSQGEVIDLPHLPLEISGLPQDAFLTGGDPMAGYDERAEAGAGAGPTGAPGQGDGTAIAEGLLHSHERVSLAELEKRYTLKILNEQDGHQGNTAKILDISPRTLYRKLKQYDEEDGAGDGAGAAET